MPNHVNRPLATQQAQIRNRARTRAEKPRNVNEYLHPGRGRTRQGPAPTPWMTITTPATQVPYKCRVLVKRRGGALHLEFDTDVNPPDVAGRSVYMHSSRSGYFQFIQAGHALLRASMWDPRCAPGERAVWNANSAEYALRSDHAMTVALYIDRLLYPKPGRPGRQITRSELDAAQGNPKAGLRTGYLAARSRRRNELLGMAQRMQNALVQVAQEMEDPRRFVGYTKLEQTQIRLHLGEIRGAVDTLRSAVFSDRLGGERVAPPVVDRSVRALLDSTHEEMTHDLDDAPALPSITTINEQEIATAQIHDAEAVPHMVPVFMKPDEMEWFYEHHEIPASAMARTDEERQELWDELHARLGRRPT